MTGTNSQIIFKGTTNVYARFTDWLQSILNATDEKISIALSGGNTPKTLFEYWATEHRNDIDWHKINFFWGDERCVPPDDAQSNYHMTKEYLFDHLPISDGQIFRIEGENAPETEAKRYSEILGKKLGKENGIPSFDIVMLGMGDDGHTASIFPNQMDLWNNPEICVVGIHPQSGQKRVSLSGTTINAAKRVAFLVTGKNKAEKVREIIEEPKKARLIYPAARVSPQAGKLLWFLDDAAASLLSR